MLPSPNTFRADPKYQPILREIGLDADAVFTHPDIRVWRSITERENATLDATLHDGRRIRLHVKRYHPTPAAVTPADVESRGIQLLQTHGIPTVPLVGWGHLSDGRSFVLTEDLAGFKPADRLVRDGVSFDRLLEPIADLAAQLHAANLHHRDLYLCHFFARVTEDAIDLRLIDPARVARLPGPLARQRWIVKDLAQLHYSMTQTNIPPQQIDQLFARYAQQRNLDDAAPLLRKIIRKSVRIAAHDVKLKKAQPGRNISIPDAPPS